MTLVRIGILVGLRRGGEEKGERGGRGGGRSPGKSLWKGNGERNKNCKGTEERAAGIGGARWTEEKLK